MTTTKRLGFGLQPPEGVTVAWGARAWYKYHPSAERVMIDLLHDRQDRIGSGEELTPLLDWLNEEGLAALKRELARYAVTGDSDASGTVRKAPFVIEASPNASYGYLYIVAYVQPAAE